MPAPKRENPVLVGGVIGINRIQRGLSLDELAQSAGVTWESIKSVEQGERMPDQEWLTKVAMSLGTTADGLLSEVDHIDEKQELFVGLLKIVNNGDSEALKELIEFCQKLTEEDNEGDGE